MLFQTILSLNANRMNPNLDLAHELSLKTAEGFTFFDYLQIVRFQSEGNHTMIYLSNEDTPRKVLHSFSDIEQKTTNHALFFKCHRSHIININHLKHFYIKTNILVTAMGEVPISETYVQEFKDRFCK